MDPMTQSAQISSSQGFADGQNSAAKESKMSDKRVVLGSDKPCEGVATSLRFPSQPGSFTPGNYGSEAGPPDGQPDSPIKTSPVSERIKALEALAAKKKEPDFRSDGGFSHYRDRHHEKSEKSPTEATKSTTEATKSPTEAPKPSTETPKSPTETPKSPTETPRSPTETPRSPTETPRSPTETPRSPTETPRSQTETPKSPTETPKSPTETPKSPTDKFTPASQKRESSSDLDSPESPFEVLGELRQGSEFEETEEWMKAHLPPVPDFDAVDLIKGAPSSGNATSKEEKVTDIVIPEAPAAFAGVPEAFKDSPAEAPKPKDDTEAQKQKSVEEESEFDLSFLPTAYMWDQEKSGVQPPSNANPASPAPPAGFGSPLPPDSQAANIDGKLNASEDKKLTLTGDLDPPEASEADSSGESDDTVIEDGVKVPASSSNPADSNDSTATPASSEPDPTTEETETPPPRSERKLMQVPTINVIETDEPNYSEEEMDLEAEEDEDYEVVKDPAREGSRTPELEETKDEPTKKRPLETEFMEGYSPPSSPVDSEEEYSPECKVPRSLPETVNQETTSKPEAQPEKIDSIGSVSETEKSSTSSKVIEDPYAFMVSNEEVDFPDNDDEWSDEAQDMIAGRTELKNPYSLPKEDEKSSTQTSYMETASFPKSTFMQDDIYDRQSFDYDYDASCPMDDIDDKRLNNAKERFLSDPISVDKLDTLQEDSQNLENDDDDSLSKQVPRDYPEDPYSSFRSEPVSSVTEDNFQRKTNTEIVVNSMENGKKVDAKIQNESKSGHQAPDKAKNQESIDADSSEPTDSFVDFMRECLKSRQDDEPGDADSSKKKPGNTDLPPSQNPPTVVMDLEQEQLTISALKELGSSQEEEEEVTLIQSKVPNRDNLNAASVQQSSITSAPNPPSSQSSTYSKEVDAIDEWVAEAYHLAEHVLTAILTHLSVRDLIHWRDPKKSGLVFGLSMLLLLSLAAFSVISVVSYLLLALLCVTITFRIYKSVVQAVQKSSDGHPFKSLIDKDVSIPPETFRKHVDSSLTYINRGLKQMSRLFLVEDLVDSLKLAVVMWLFTYVGAVFNGITILILADILLFAVPPIYEKNKTQIDQYIDLVRTQVNTTMAKLQEKLPGAVKRSKTE